MPLLFLLRHKGNRQLSSKVCDVLAKLLRTRLDGDDLFIRYKVESMAAEKDSLANRIAKLEA